MTTALPPWLRVYLWGNLHLALGAGLCTWATRSGLAGGPVVPGLRTAAIALGAASVYGFDRLLGAKSATGPRGDWFHRHRRAMWAWSLGAGMGGLVCLALLPWREQGWLAAGGLLGMAYGLKVVPWRGGWRRLGSFLWTRPWLVALVWMLGTATLPLVERGASLVGADALRWQAGRFLLAAALVIPFDVRDRRVDRREGVATLATWLGARAALRIAVVLAVAAAVLAACPAPQPEALVAAVAAAGLLVFTHERRGALWRLLLLDGVLHLHALGVLWRYLMPGFFLGSAGVMAALGSGLE